MKNIPSILAALVLIAVLGLFMCTFQVRSTEVAILKTFGEANRTPIEVDANDQSFLAGLKFKWPWPIQSVAKYDKRIRLLEDRIEETPTRDGNQIVVTTYTGWRIFDPYKFHTQYQDVKVGEDSLRARIRTHKKAVIGRHDFSEFVSTDPNDRKLEEIQEEMRDAVAGVAKDEFGIEIVMFGIKQLTLPQKVTEQVFTTMKTAQETKAVAFRAEGAAAAQRITSNARAARQRILSVVNKKVAEIESEAQEEVGRIYESFHGHEELRIFLDELRAMQQLFKRRTTFIIDMNMLPMNLWDDDRRILSDDQPLGIPAGKASSGVSHPTSPAGATDPSGN